MKDGEARFAALLIRPEDHSEAEAAVTGVPLEVDRLTAGTATARFTQFVLGDVDVITGNYGAPIHSRGAVAPGRALVGLQLTPSGGHWNGHGFGQDTAWLYGPGAEHDGVGLQPTSFAVVGVPARLADALRGDVMPAGCVHVRTGAATESLRGVIAGLLDLTATTADEAGRLEPRLASAARASVIDSLANVLHLGQAAPRLDAGAAARIVERCMQAVADLGPQPSPLDLSATTSLTDRRIRAAFNERFGVPVATYFRHRALHAAHRDLVHARSDQTTVADVAGRWGFWHLGRFAQRYRAQFGVTPMTTLRVTSP